MSNTQRNCSAQLEPIYAELARQNDQLTRLLPELVVPRPAPKSESASRSHLTMRRV